MKRATLLLIALFIALAPAGVSAENGESKGGFALRIDGDLYVGPGEILDSAVVVDGHALIEGRITETLVVIAGSVEISGRVDEDVVLIDSDLLLTSTANVRGDVIRISGDLTRQTGSVIGGEVRDEFDLSIQWWSVALVSLLAWVGFTVLVVVAALVLAAVARRQSSGAAALLTDQTAYTILATVVTFLALPIAAFFIMFTAVGIPLALSVFFFLLPALGFFGYLITGLMIGNQILGKTDTGPEGKRPYLAAILGMLILQLVLLVPVIGWFIALIAGLWGAGGVVLYAWNAWRSPSKAVSTEPAD